MLLCSLKWILIIAMTLLVVPQLRMTIEDRIVFLIQSQHKKGEGINRMYVCTFIINYIYCDFLFLSPESVLLCLLANYITAYL